MEPISKLASYFALFPGIGGRQSKRFVYFLLRQSPSYLRELSALVASLQQQVTECVTCHRYYTKKGGELNGQCLLCTDSMREDTTLLIIERDSDLENIERSGAYHGRYFVLGGTLQILEKEPERAIRIIPLEKHIPTLIARGLSEIIIATSVTSESEHTADYLRQRMTPLIDGSSIKITTLGRGLSTGSELEYADPETLRYAIEGRK